MRYLLRLFWLGCALLVAARSANAADPTLEDVTRGYRASIAVLDPLWMQCRFSRTYATEVPEAGWENVGAEQIEWAIDGQKFHYSRDAPETTSWFSYDGQTTWQFDYGFASRGEDPDEPVAIRRQRLATKTDSTLRNRPTPGLWLGLYFAAGSKFQSGESISTMLEKQSAHVVGIEVVDGHPCVRVSLRFAMLNGEGFPADVWFDPAVGHLPRRILLNYRPRVEVENELLVTAFRALPATSAAAVYVPTEMTRRWTDAESPVKDFTERLVLEEADLDQSLRGELFTPQRRQGIPVFDMDDRDSRIQWQAHLSELTDEREQKTAWPPPLSQALPATMPIINPATPDSARSWPTLLFVLGVGLLVLATWSFARR